jgi:xylan 1,4-beta-xylosidase
MPQLELHYTEWSASYTPTDYIHDTYFEASYILDKIKGVGNATTSMSYWVFTDIFEEAGPRFTPFHGGFGLINYQAINKPAFYAFQFLNRLGETELNNKDSASWACKNSKGDLQLLFWNFTNTHPGDSINDQVYYNQILPSKNSDDVKVNIVNAKPGKYLLSIYMTGYKVNDAFTKYLELGSPSQLTKIQVDTIKNASNGAPIESRVIRIKRSAKSYELCFNMRQNDIYLVALTKL